MFGLLGVHLANINRHTIMTILPNAPPPHRKFKTKQKQTKKQTRNIRNLNPADEA